MISDDFECLLVTKGAEGKIHRQVGEKNQNDLPAGDVLIRVAYSSLNYKDALSATGHPGVTRVFPHVPGIDVAGTVAQSNSPMLRQGEEVLVTGFDQGQNTWGGFAEFVRVPAAWVMPLPRGLTLREAMIYGTAGLTAGQCVEALQHNEIDPSRGEIVVTGSSGGVGSLAVAILAQAGYQVVASTGKPTSHEFLSLQGARRIVSREEVHDTGKKPLLPSHWAGAIDTVGGATLSTLVRSTSHSGCVACCGLVGGIDLPLTIYPFILRGVALVGIDSAECPLETRTRIWNKLAGEWKPKHLASIVTEEVGLNQLEAPIQRILAGQTMGRVLVKI